MKILMGDSGTCKASGKIVPYIFFLMMRNRGSLMPVLIVLVSWLKETTFSIEWLHV